MHRLYMLKTCLVCNWQEFLPTNVQQFGKSAAIKENHFFDFLN